MTKKHVKQGGFFVPQAPYLILRPWRDDEAVPQSHRATSLSGFGSRAVSAAGGGGGPVSVSFLGSASGTGSSVTVNVDPGAASADRFILVAGAQCNNILRTIDSATVDGNTATAVGAERGSGANSGIVRGFYYNYTSGTANIDCVVNFSGAAGEGAACMVYKITGHGTTWAGVEFGDTNSSPLQSDGTQDVAADGAVIAWACSLTNPAYTWTFGATSPTEDVDALQNNCQYSSASHEFSTVQTNITITADQTPENRNGMQGVTLDPA